MAAIWNLALRQQESHDERRVSQVFIRGRASDLWLPRVDAAKGAGECTQGSKSLQSTLHGKDSRRAVQSSRVQSKVQRLLAVVLMGSSETQKTLRGCHNS